MHRTFTLHTQEPDGVSGANQEEAAVPSEFVPLGVATHAVVMNLRSKLPRIKVSKGGAGLHEREEGRRGPL